MIVEVVERMWFHHNTEPKMLEEFLPGQKLELSAANLFVMDKDQKPPRTFTPVVLLGGKTAVLVDPVELVRKCRFIGASV